MKGPTPTKYWCEYCRMFVHNNAASRKMHEATNKHKFNIQMHLRGIYKDQDKKTKEDSQMQKMLAQIEKDAIKQYGAETGKSVSSLMDSSSFNKKVSKAQGHSKNDTSDTSASVKTEANDSLEEQQALNPDTGIGDWEEVNVPESNQSIPTSDGSFHQESKDDVKRHSDQAQQQHAYNSLVDDDEEDGDKEQTSSFKITEKVIQITHFDDDATKQTSAVFKKRKMFGGKNGADKKRNIRSKD